MGRLLREEDVLEGLDYGIKIISDKNIGYNYMRLLGATREMVKNLPTAYDVEAVVEELEEAAYDSMHLDMSRPMTETWQIIDLDKAIEVVRRGGVK